MFIYNKDFEFAKTRLNGSYVGYEGCFHLMQHRDRGDSINLINTRTYNEHTVKISKLDLTPPKIGYYNTVGGANHVVRCNKVQYRQGIRSEVLITSIRGKVDLNECSCWLTNIYPSVEDCLNDIINEEVFSKAFSKDFCLKLRKNAVKLLYKEDLVGSWNNGDFNLDNKFFYLKQALDEVLV